VILQKFKKLDSWIQDQGEAKVPEEIENQCSDRYDSALKKLHRFSFYGIFFLTFSVFIFTGDKWVTVSAFFFAMTITAVLKIAAQDRLWKRYRREYVEKDSICYAESFHNSKVIDP
jgi:hypothetical protein